MASNHVETAVRDYYADKVSEDTRKLIRAANWDLYNGPLSASEAEDLDLAPWPGFSKACDQIREALDVSDLWVDLDSDAVCEGEPVWCSGVCSEELHAEEFHEDPDHWTHVAPDRIREILVGTELARYL